GGAWAGGIGAGFLGFPRNLGALFSPGTEQQLYGAVGEDWVFPIIQSEVGQDREGVGIDGTGARVQMRGDEGCGFVDGRSPIAGILERPGDVSGNAEEIVVVAVGGSFIDKRAVWFPT